MSALAFFFFFPYRRPALLLNHRSLLLSACKVSKRVFTLLRLQTANWLQVPYETNQACLGGRGKYSAIVGFFFFPLFERRVIQGFKGKCNAHIKKGRPASLSYRRDGRNGRATSPFPSVVSFSSAWAPGWRRPSLRMWTRSSQGEGEEKDERDRVRESGAVFFFFCFVPWRRWDTSVCHVPFSQGRTIRAAIWVPVGFRATDVVLKQWAGIRSDLWCRFKS